MPTPYSVAGYNFTYNLNKTFVLDERLHIVPDQVFVTNGYKSGVRSYTYQSAEEVVDQMAMETGLTLGWDWDVNMGLVNFSIPVSISPSLATLQKNLLSHGGVYSVVREDINLYTLRLLPNSTLSPTFVNDIRSMGSNPSHSQWDQFTSKFGTHVQTGLDMGGMLWYGGYNTASDLRSETATTVGMGIRLAFINIKLPDVTARSYAGHNRQASPAYKSNFQLFTVGGGPRGTGDWYEPWVKSVPSQPARTNYQLDSISSYIRQVDADLAAQYDAYVAYTIKSQNTVAGGKAPDLPVYLSYGYSSSITNYGRFLTGASLWSDDDDEYYWGFWYTSSDGTPAAETFTNPVVQSWETKPWGSPQYADAHSKSATRPPHGRLRTMALATYAQDCGFYPCIPGLETIGAGYDIQTGEIRLPTLEWTFNQAKTFRSQTGHTYSVPDQISIDADTRSRTLNQVYKSFDEYSKNATNANTSGWHHGKFQWGADCQSIRQVFYKAQSVLAVSERQYIQYTLSITDTNYRTSPYLMSAMDALPAVYDRATYWRFLLQWGTHVSTTGLFGGRARLFSMVDQDWFTSRSEDSITKDVSLQWSNWEAGIRWGNTQSSSTASFSKATAQWLSFYGGDATLALTNDWAEWIDSTKYAPAKLFNDLVPIQSLGASSQVAANLERAVEEYYGARSPPNLPPVALNMQLSFSSGSSLIHDDTQTYVWQHHDAFNPLAITTYLVSDVSYGGVTWKVPYGSLTPGTIRLESMQQSPSVSYRHQAKCPSDSWVSHIDRKHCDPDWDSDSLCFDLSTFTCSKLYY